MQRRWGRRRRRRSESTSDTRGKPAPENKPSILCVYGRLLALLSSGKSGIRSEEEAGKQTKAREEDQSRENRQGTQERSRLENVEGTMGSAVWPLASAKEPCWPFSLSLYHYFFSA